MRRASRYAQKIMTVPRMIELRPGVSVNIVLKADQPTGKLTNGQIADILTRGDHPRGIKVRLTDGQIGRVQSLSTSTYYSVSSESAPLEGASQSSDINGRLRPDRARRGLPRFREGSQPEPAPTEATSLFDYVKKPRGKKENNPLSKTKEAANAQKLLENEFQSFDSALVAAILLDHENDVSAARATLSSLSGD